MTKLLLRSLVVLLFLAAAGWLCIPLLPRDEARSPKAIYQRLEELAYNKSMPDLFDELKIAGEAHLDLDHRNADGLRPLDLAAGQDQGDAAAAFVVAGSNINAADTAGDTVMHIAARHHALHVLKELRRFMPDLSLRNKDGQTPADLAQQMGDNAAVTLLTAPLSSL
jgi:ankyrin repeat protein